jgi:hypothetical protein
MKKKYLVIRTYSQCEPSAVKSFINADTAQQFCDAMNKDNSEETGNTEPIYFIAIVQGLV